MIGRLRSIGSLALVAGALPIIACYEQGTTAPDKFGPPARVEIVSGDSQQGVVAAALWEPLVVRVVDRVSHPLQGQRVAFTVLSGRGRVSPDTATTDADGLARTTWTLGTSTAVADSGRVQARVTGSNASPATFAAVAKVGHPITMQKVRGDFQAGRLGAPLDEPLVVRLTDPYGNPAAEYGVWWGVTNGGSVTPDFVKADAAGYASARWTLAPNSDAVGAATAFFYDPTPQLLEFSARAAP
jgi:hypothetical protein